MGVAGPLIEGALTGAAEYTKLGTMKDNKKITATAFGDIANMASKVYAQHLLNKQLDTSIKTVKRQRKSMEKQNKALLQDSIERRRSFISQELPG